MSVASASRMIAEFFLQGPRSHRLGAWFGLVVFVGHQVYRAWLKYAINSWYEGFYNLMQTAVERGKDDDGDIGSGAEELAARLYHLRERVGWQLLAFGCIVATAVVVHPIAGFAKNWFVFSWRRTLVESYLDRWAVNVPPIEGASQRVHEDTQRFAAGIQTCVASLLEAVLTLAVFCPVLYELDPTLVTIATVTASGGVCISFLVGHRLVALEVNNQKVEACLRRRLVVLEVDPAAVTDEHGGVLAAFSFDIAGLVRNYWALYVNFAWLATWLSAFDQFAVLLPYLIAAPRLFAADPARVLTLGQLVKLTNSFSAVFSSLNIVSDNYLAINEWRSVIRRLAEWERALRDDGPPVRRDVELPIRSRRQRARHG